LALTTRRQFVQQTAFTVAALYGHAIKEIAGAWRIFEAREQNAAPLDAAAVRRLASEITGHVITPETPDYESARLVFNRAFDRRPALIVRCAGAPDVARALEFAQNQNLPMAVRGGGHNRAGSSVCDGGVVIDLSGMNRVEVDAGKCVARAEAGALVRDLDHATQHSGLATTSGGEPRTGRTTLAWWRSRKSTIPRMCCGSTRTSSRIGPRIINKRRRSALILTGPRVAPCSQWLRAV